VAAAAALSGIAAISGYLNAKFHIRHDLKNGSPDSAAEAAFEFLAQRQAEDKLLTYHFLQAWAEDDRPHHLFLEFNGSRWTYRQFYLEVQRVGNWLLNDLKIERNEVVALDGGNSCSYMLLWFALEGIGACPAFINCNLTSDSLQHCVKVSGVAMITRFYHTSADRVAVGRFKIPPGGESYRTSGRALSGQFGSRPRADTVLRR
jgi:hypothetical protein